MGSSSKSGSQSKSYDYFGTIALQLGIGPIKSISNIIEDNKSIGSWPLTNTGASSNLTTISSRGKLRIHWGNSGQTTNPLLSAYDTQPPYKDRGLMVGEDFLFGRERTSAPNWQAWMTRAPAQSVVTGNAAVLDSNGQANLVAIAAEVVTAIYCLGQPSATLATSSWQAQAEALDTTDQRELYAVSPTITAQTSARAFFEQVFSLAGLWVRRTDGLIEMGRWTPPADTSSLPTVTAADLLEDMEMSTEEMDSLPTEYTIEFTDRERLYKKGMEKVADVAAGRVDTPLTENIASPEVTIRSQARKRLAEYQRQRRGGALTGRAQVRRTKGRQIRPGDYFMVDVDPIPDASSSMLLVRCLRRSYKPTGGVSIEWQSEPGAVPVPYVTPTSIVDISPAIVIPAPTRPRLISLKPYAGEAPSITPLCARPEDGVVGLDVLYDSQASTGTFPVIGTAGGFALPVTLPSSVTAGATTVQVKTFAAFSDGRRADRDRWLLSDGINVGDTEAADDRLVLVLLKRDPSTGAIRPNGTAKAFEVMSISAVSMPATDTWNLTVLRGRLGSTALAFDTSDGASFPDAFSQFEGWVLPGASLERMQHAEFLALAKASTAATFRLRPWSAASQYDPTEAYDAGLQASDAWTDLSYTWPADDLLPQASEVPTTDLVVVNTVSTPSISPGAGLFDTSVTLSVTAAPGAVVRYSTTGDVTANSPEWPTSSGSYTTLTLSTTTTLRVRAFNGAALSDQLTLQYTKNTSTPKVATPNLQSMTSSNGILFNMTFACATAGATIWIATSSDGVSWSSYTVRTTCTVSHQGGARAYATLSGWDDSDVIEITP